jgi:hypothetical protein
MWNANQKGTGMTKENERLAREREQIAARVAGFKAIQEKFKREREEYFVTTLEKALHGDNSRRAVDDMPPGREPSRRSGFDRRSFR